MLRRRHRDGASTHVLEVVAVALVMIGSVAYVVTLDTPPVVAGGQRAALQQKVSDALAVMNDTPYANELGSNLLEVAIHECLQNDCSRLAKHLDKSMPPGSRYGVYLSTKDGMMPVLAPREPHAEAVSARRTIEPAWSYQFLGLSQSVYNPLEDAAVVYGLPVYSGDVVQQGSSGLRITLDGARDDQAVYKLKASGTTRAVESGASPTPAAASLFFHAGDGVALAARDVTGTTIDLAGKPTQAPVRMHLRLQETGGGLVPAGTQVLVQVPHGWTASAQIAANDADWTWVSDATDKSGSATGSTVAAKLKRDISSTFVDFAIDARYHGDANDHYTFSAALSAGAYARAQALVRGDDHASVPPFEHPTVLVSVPRPLGVGATTTWTLAAFSSDTVGVSRIEIAEEEGRAIFGNVAGLSGPGSWTHTGDKLVWTGSATLTHDAPLALTFAVTSSALGGPASDRAPFFPSVAMGEHVGRLTDETSPGLYRGVFLPKDGEYGGYETSTGEGLRAAHTARSESLYRTTKLPGSVDYEVGYVLGLKDSVFGSAVTAERRSVEPGGTATLAIDVQSVMYELAAAGLTPSIDVYVYAPWTGAKHEPKATYAVYDGTLAAGSDPFLSVIDLDGDLRPDPTAVGRHSVDVPIPKAWLYGPYVVEARVTWLERLNAVVNGAPLTEEIVRSASVYDYFVVRPTDDGIPASPLYDVHLVAWFDDWG